jgi:hypothetical protein
LSNVWEESQDIHFIVASISSYPFEISKMNYDKCGLYIGLCLGKANGCNQNGMVFGSNPYTYQSNLCTSALHSGVINSSGGLFGIHHGGPVSRFPATISNGITSEKVGYEGESFMIKGLK